MSKLTLTADELKAAFDALSRAGSVAKAAASEATRIEALKLRTQQINGRPVVVVPDLPDDAVYVVGDRVLVSRVAAQGLMRDGVVTTGVDWGREKSWTTEIRPEREATTMGWRQLRDENEVRQAVGCRCRRDKFGTTVLDADCPIHGRAERGLARSEFGPAAKPVVCVCSYDPARAAWSTTFASCPVHGPVLALLKWERFPSLTEVQWRQLDAAARGWQDDARSAAERVRAAAEVLWRCLCDEQGGECPLHPDRANARPDKKMLAVAKALAVMERVVEPTLTETTTFRRPKRVIEVE